MRSIIIAPLKHDAYDDKTLRAKCDLFAVVRLGARPTDRLSLANNFIHQAKTIRTDDDKKLTWLMAHNFSLRFARK